MATSGAVSSGQGDLEPDGQAVLSVCTTKTNNGRSMVRPRLANRRAHRRWAQTRGSD